MPERDFRPALRAAVVTPLERRTLSFPSWAGEGVPEGRMGCGSPPRPKSDCTSVTANLQRAIPAFHTPSGAIARRKTGVFDALWRHLPRFAEKGNRAARPRKLEREFSRASSKLPGRPSGGPSGLTGARQVSWLAAYRRRRLPRRDAQWRRCVGTPLTVAGPAAVRRNACRVPFSPSFVARDRAVFMFQLRWGLSNARRENRGPRLIDLNASDPVCS